MLPHTFTLETYALAQALDYLFLMDDDAPALIPSGEYPIHAAPHTLLTEDTEGAIGGETRASA